MLQGETHSVYFSRSFSSLGTHHAHTFWNFNHTLCCILNHGNTLVQLLHCLLLSSCEPESLKVVVQGPDFWPTPLYIHTISTGWSCWASFATFERPWEFLDPVVNHFTQQTLLCEYLLHWVLLPTKTYNRMQLFNSILLKHGRILTTETSLWTCACASAT
jgi:hypothetical protein